MADSCMCKSLVDREATCNACVTKLRETLTRLNRRCQEAESAACVKVEEVRKSGPSLGRALAGWAAANYQRKYDAAQKEIEDLKKKSQAESFLDAAKFLETMPSWTDPGEFMNGWDAAVSALKEKAEFLLGKKTS